MNYGQIKTCDIANGVGVRVTLFVSGCTNHCYNCFQPQTWDFHYGQPFDAAAEQIIFGKISTGALSDLEKVSRQAMAMVTIYGLNEKIGNITYYDSTGQRDYGFTKPYSEKTAQIIDEEISKIVEEQYQRALKILSDNRDKLTRLAEMLLEREVIFKEDLIEIFGPRPFPDVEDGQDMNRAVHAVMDEEESR